MFKTNLNTTKESTFYQDIKVSENHIDRLGHTNNVRYLEWLEKTAWKHIETLGYGWDQMNHAGISMAVMNTNLKYISASYAHDVLRIYTWISDHDKRFKCNRSFKVIRLIDNKEILTASMQFGCIRLVNGRPTRMPEALSEALTAGIG